MDTHVPFMMIYLLGISMVFDEWRSNEGLDGFNWLLYIRFFQSILAIQIFLQYIKNIFYTIVVFYIQIGSSSSISSNFFQIKSWTWLWPSISFKIDLFLGSFSMKPSYLMCDLSLGLMITWYQDFISNQTPVSIFQQRIQIYNWPSGLYLMIMCKNNPHFILER